MDNIHEPKCSHAVTIQTLFPVLRGSQSASFIFFIIASSILTNPLLSELVLTKLTHIPSVRLTESPFLNNYSFTNSPLTVQPKWTWISGKWGRGQLNLSLICGRRSVWLWRWAGGPPALHHGKQVEALRHLPAITQNRCCDLTGQQARGPALWQTSSGQSSRALHRAPADTLCSLHCCSKPCFVFHTWNLSWLGDKNTSDL